MRRAIPRRVSIEPGTQEPLPPHKEAFTPKPPIPRRIGGFLLGDSPGFFKNARHQNGNKVITKSVSEASL